MEFYRSLFCLRVIWKNFQNPRFQQSLYLEQKQDLRCTQTHSTKYFLQQHPGIPIRIILL